MSEYHQYIHNPMLRAHLKYVSDMNKAKWSVCAKCGSKSTTIDAIKEKVFPVCDKCWELAHNDSIPAQYFENQIDFE